LPFVAVLEQKVKLIANFNRPVKGRVTRSGNGFPAKRDGISSFLAMMKKVAPMITENEMRKIQEGFLKAGAE
jgi:hypothetical protein